MFSVIVKKRSRLQEAIDIVYALYIREAKKRFNGQSLGILWAVLEPIAHILIFSIIYGLKSKSANTIDTPLMILSGVVPFMIFRQTLKQVTSSASGNKAVFGYPIINPIHTATARFLLEFVVLTSSLIIVYIGINIWFEVAILPSHPESLILALFFSGALGGGLGLCFMILKTFWSNTEKV